MLLLPLLMIFILGPLFLIAIFFNLMTFSFAKLGLTSQGAMLLIMAVLLGSMINLPISRRQLWLPQRQGRPGSWFFYYPPRLARQVVCVNVGGAVIPAAFSLYLLVTTAPLLPALAATAVVTLVCKLMARPRPGVGIALPVFIPPLVAALSAVILAGHLAAPVAYIAGSLGTLIGADLLNWRAFAKLESQAISIGGAGVFDGIFLVGLVAALLSPI